MYDPFLFKVKFILDSPTERKKYKNLKTIVQKIEFLKNHFIMDDRSVKSMEFRYLNPNNGEQKLINTLENIICSYDK